MLIFFHIPKTAGTSIASTLTASGTAYFRIREEGANELTSFLRENPDGLISGHFDARIIGTPLSLLETIPTIVENQDMKVFTFVRDPAKQAISYYYHELERGNTKLSIEDFCYNRHNCSYRYVFKTHDPADVLKNFMFIGDTDRVDEWMGALGRHDNLSISSVPRKNVGRSVGKSRKDSGLDPAYLRKVYDWEYELYDMVCRQSVRIGDQRDPARQFSMYRSVQDDTSGPVGTENASPLVVDKPNVIKEFCLRDRNGRTKDVFELDEDIGVELAFDIGDPYDDVEPAIKVSAREDGTLAFVGLYPKRDERPAFLRGAYRSTVWIPPHFLNARDYLVSGVLSNPVLARSGDVAPDTLVMRVIETAETESPARGRWQTDIPGLVRPDLQWQTKREAASPTGHEKSMDPLINPASRRRVAVLVTLFHDEKAGGHVKIWEKFLRVAPASDGVDLTVFFLGSKDEIIPVTDVSRIHTLPPRISTGRFRFMDSGAGHTDLAGFHPGLARLLGGFDLVISTDHFSFGRTAAKVCRDRNIPRYHSIHTDVETLTRTYAPQILRKLAGRRLGNVLSYRFGLAEKLARSARDGLLEVLKGCRGVFVSRPAEQALVQSTFSAMPCHTLRRGIELDLFHPDVGDRAWLNERFDLKDGQSVAVYAGRVDGSKNVMIAARAVHHLIKTKGTPVKLVVLGAGADMNEIRALLGEDDVRLPGVLPQQDMARVLASADVFLFPSESETFGNVVVEAKACGLPVLVSGRQRGTGRFVSAPGKDGIALKTLDIQAWSDALEDALTWDREATRTLCRTWVEQSMTSWAQVYREDIIAPLAPSAG